jgi:hypothetical protein
VRELGKVAEGAIAGIDVVVVGNVVAVVAHALVRDIDIRYY